MNIGAGETYSGYLVKRADFAAVDSFIKSTKAETTAIYPLENCVQAIPFRYRYMSADEHLASPLRAFLVNGMETMILSSETNIDPKPNDLVFLELEPERQRIVSQVVPMLENGFYAFSKTPPKMMVLK